MVARAGALEDPFHSSQGAKLEAKPATPAASALKFPAEPTGGADDGMFLSTKNAGKNERCASTAMFFQPGEKMEKERVVKISQDQIGRGKRGA